MLQKFDERNRDLIVNINSELVHRDQARVSPFDSAVQGGDAVWEGLRLYQGRIFRLEQHLDRLVHSAKALAFRTFRRAPRSRTDPPHARREPHVRRRAHPADTDARRENHVGHGPAAEYTGPTLIVLAEHKPPVYASDGISPGHQQRAAVSARLPRPENPSQQPDPVDPGQDRGQRRGRRRRADARPAGFHRRDQRDARVPRRSGPVRTPRLVACPEGITRAAVLELCARTALRTRRRDLTLTEAYRARRNVLHRHDGRTRGRDPGRRPRDRRRQAGPMTARLTALFRELTAREGTVVSAPRRPPANDTCAASPRSGPVSQLFKAPACQAMWSGMNVWMK